MLVQLELEPTAVELFDQMGLRLCRDVPQYARLLETFVEGSPIPRNPAYLLKPGELAAMFDDYELLHSAEGEQASLIARKPA